MKTNFANLILICISAVLASEDIDTARLDESLTLLHQEDYAGFGMDYYYGYTDYSVFDSLSYQENLNYDYMTYDRYDLFRPFGNQYTTYNEDRKIMNINDVMDCGDCLRGGYIFCTKGSGLGTPFETVEEKPLGLCCKNRDTCADYLNNTEFNCSTSYTDDLL